MFLIVPSGIENLDRIIGWDWDKYVDTIVDNRVQAKWTDCIEEDWKNKLLANWWGQFEHIVKQ